MPWLMKPYLDNGHLTRERLHFNKTLSRTRIVVENPFGQLKGRWRILLKRLDVKTEFAPTVVATCCMLHNFCEMSGECMLDDWIDEEEADNVVNEGEEDDREPSAVAGGEVRDALGSYLCE